MKALNTIFLILVLQFNLIGQNVEVKSFVDKSEIFTNEVITFTITSNADCDIYTPNFGGLKMIGQPFRSSSSMTLEVNGRVIQQSKPSLIYQFVAPKAGTYTISAIRLLCKGKEYKTKPIKVTVKSIPQSQKVTIPKNNSDFFIKMNASKTSVFQGESFVLSLKVYSLNQPENFDNLELGTSKGLIRNNLNPDQRNLNFTIEFIQGKKYYTTVINSELCFAQNTGKIEISPALVSAVFSRGFFQKSRKEANSNALTIAVKPRKEAAPENDNGLVGTFSLSAATEKFVYSVGEAIDLQIKISGNGNLNTFDTPNLQVHENFEVFDPEVTDSLKYDVDGITGNISYNFVIIPKAAGQYKIPPISFSYFDLDSESYQSKSTDTIFLKIKEGQANINPESGVNSASSGAENSLSDIRYSESFSDQELNHNSFIIKKIWFYLLIVILVFMVWFFINQHVKNQTDSHQLKNSIKVSRKESLLRLKTAKRLANEQQNKDAITELSIALKSFIKQKNNLSNYDMSSHQIVEFYTKKYWSQADLALLQNIWSQIDMFQYAPISSNKLDDLIKNTELLIDKIDQTE
ncbi:MAG: BatD family protein [Crocinitomicaceae bacterium]